MKFRHFILTRFNVALEPADFTGRLENNWLSTRLDLFQRFCFPSVQQQSCQDFTWLVLFDECTPKNYVSLIESFTRYENFVPIFCGQPETILPKVVKTIKELSDGFQWVLSTRLDNDDALERNFTQTLHSIVKSLFRNRIAFRNEVILNFMNGLQYCNGDLYDFKDAANAFFSLLEKKVTAKSVLWVDHPGSCAEGTVLQLDTPPLWLQTVHGTNLYNHIRGTRIENKALLKSFSVRP